MAAMIFIVSTLTVQTHASRSMTVFIFGFLFLILIEYGFDRTLVPDWVFPIALSLRRIVSWVLSAFSSDLGIHYLARLDNNSFCKILISAVSYSYFN
jgi:hypothetical protein